MYKQILAKIGNGILTGLGFGLVLVGTLLAAERYFDDFGAVPTDQEYNKDAGLIIQSHKDLRGKYSTAVVGTIQNTGNGTWKHVKLSVELFDKNGQFLDKCEDYENELFSPQKMIHFKVSCGGCEKQPVVDYHHYVVRIVDAEYQKPR